MIRIYTTQILRSKGALSKKVNVSTDGDRFPTSLPGASGLVKLTSTDGDYDEDDFANGDYDEDDYDEDDFANDDYDEDDGGDDAGARAPLRC